MRTPGQLRRLACCLGAGVGAVGATAQEAAAQHQQPCLLQIDGALAGVRIGGADYADHGAALRAELPAGDYWLRFGAGAAGRPAPLPVQAPAGGFVHAAVPIAAAGAEPTAPLAGPFDDSRVFGTDDAGDVRVRVRARATSAGGVFGLVCRFRDDANCYSFLLDVAGCELRLERRLGGATVVLAKAKAPPAAAWHDLELQADGFRLQAFCDDESIAQVLDGAIESGRYGTFVGAGAAAVFSELIVAAPAPAVASLAAVTAPGSADMVAGAPAHVDGVYALCLRLDQPLALLPHSAAGCEWFLLREPREPLLLFGFAFGRIGPQGQLHGALRWPPLPALRGQAALVGGLLGAPDASMVVGRLPWASIRF